MAKPILNSTQILFLKLFGQSALSSDFYFTEGTALSHFYLHHRFSEDLDFFTENEFEIQTSAVFIKSLQKRLNFINFDYQQSFNRNIYQLRFGDASFLKIEFTYYPFKQIETPHIYESLRVDSLVDIAANKLFTISQQPRGRDYFDLYSIHQRTPLDLKVLRIQAKTKFDWHIDPLQLGSQFERVDTFLDDPIIVSETNKEKMVEYFKKMASSLKDEILE